MKEIKQVKVILGRFQPFTLGHFKIATYTDLKGPDKEQSDALREQPNLEEIAKLPTVILSILTPPEKVDSRHPFTSELMEEEYNIIKKTKEIEDIIFVKSADICAWGEMLKEKGYQAAVWITGSDEFPRYKPMAIKVPQYEETSQRNFKDACTKSFYCENVERTDDGEFTSTISATKVRESLKNDDKEAFKKMMPKGTDILFDKFKEALAAAPAAPEKKPKKVKEGMKSLKDFINEKLN